VVDVLNGTRTCLQSTEETLVSQKYRSLLKHPKLFDAEAGWQPEWFDCRFLAALLENTEAAWKQIVTEHIPGKLFSCKMFSDYFCELLIEEIDHFATTGLRARRPNSMNNYGIILNEIGWRPMVNILQDNVLAKISARYWPHIAPFDGHHTFVVRYKSGEDLGLDMHTDASDVTFNLCLGKHFTGCGLKFCGFMGEADHRKHSYTYPHEKGRCCWHLGRLRHGADDIVEGERLNLIIWNHSSTYKKAPEYQAPDYQKEIGPPDIVCLSYTHDRDYGVFIDYTDRNSEFQGWGWCPPPPHVYDFFQAEIEPEGGVKKQKE